MNEIDRLSYAGCGFGISDKFNQIIILAHNVVFATIIKDEVSTPYAIFIVVLAGVFPLRVNIACLVIVPYAKTVMSADKERSFPIIITIRATIHLPHGHEYLQHQKTSHLHATNLNHTIVFSRDWFTKGVNISKYCFHPIAEVVECSIDFGICNRSDTFSGKQICFIQSSIKLTESW